MTTPPPPASPPPSAPTDTPKAATARADLTLPTSAATVPVTVLERIPQPDGTELWRCALHLWTPVEQLVPPHQIKPLDGEDYSAVPVREAPADPERTAAP